MAGASSIGPRHPNRSPASRQNARATMHDGLPWLLPDDPQNLLSVEARKRIQRALIETDKIVWEAEVAIEAKGLDRHGPKAKKLRNKASFDKARAMMRVFRAEFSRLGIRDRQYRQIMHDEIDSASSSLQLSGAQRRLLENESFFQEDQPAHRAPVTTSPPPAKPTGKAESVAVQIDRLRRECQLPADDLAEKVGMDIRTVRRHLNGGAIPHDRNIWAYQRVFSKLLNRQVVINKTP
jgi:hypothetical protein